MVGMKKHFQSWFASFTMAAVLLLGFGAPALAQSAQEQINNGLCAGSNLEFTTNPGECDTANDEATSRINQVIHTIVNLLSALVGVVAVIMIIVGGFRYITSGGNDTSVTSAKNTILYAIIGLVVVALAQLIVRFTLSKLTNG
jgi:hypothetical protein